MTETKSQASNSSFSYDLLVELFSGTQVEFWLQNNSYKTGSSSTRSMLQLLINIVLFVCTVVNVVKPFPVSLQ